MRVAQPSALAAAAVVVSLLGGRASADSSLACYRRHVAVIAGAAPGLVADASCGDAGSIAHCLADVLPQQAAAVSGDGVAVHAAVAACYQRAGCTDAEAAIEAQWLLRACSGGAAVPPKRQRPTAQTAQRTTQPTAQPTAAAAPLDLDPVLRIQQRAAATTASTTTSLVCQTTTTVSTTVCPIQSTGPKAGKERLSCYPTTDAFPTCAAGLMCTTDDLGIVTCMRRQNGLDALGVVIASVFASALVIGTATICFCCCRERRQLARDAKAADAAAIARQAAIDRKRPAAAVRSASAGSRLGGGGHHPDAQPLMAQQQGGGGGGHDGGYDGMPPVPTIYASDATADITGPNPFADRPQLR